MTDITAFISAMSPLQCRTTSQPAARLSLARCLKSPDSAFIDRSSLIRSPSKPMDSRMIFLMAFLDVVAGRERSMAV